MGTEFKEYLNRHVTKPSKNGKANAVQMKPTRHAKASSKTKPRAFEAHLGATKFNKLPFIQEKMISRSEFIEREEKEKLKAAKHQLKKNEVVDNEMLAFYFMELTAEQQDDLLVEHMIIMPDEIRNDLEKISDFISKNKTASIGFVPIEKILKILREDK